MPLAIEAGAHHLAAGNSGHEGRGVTHILITGGNRGLGWAMVDAALERGWRVSLTHRGAADGLPPGVRGFALDVTDHAALAAMASQLGPLDVLINNAGVIGPQRQGALDMDFEGFAQTLAINTLAPLAVAQAVLPNLRAAGRGRVLSISSQMAWMGYAKSDHLAYRASKVALNKVMQGLATELAGEGIAVALVDRGWVRTDMGGAAAELEPGPVARGILDLAARLEPAQSGRFFRHDGTEREF